MALFLPLPLVLDLPMLCGGWVASWEGGYYLGRGAVWMLWVLQEMPDPESAGDRWLLGIMYCILGRSSGRMRGGQR